MSYGTARVSQIIWNSGGGDTVLDYNSGIRNGDNYSGGILQAQSLTGVTGTFTASISGNTLQGSFLYTDTLSGVSGIFTSIASGSAITGTSLNATNVTGGSVSGATLSGTTASIDVCEVTGNLTASTFTAPTGDITTITAQSGRFTSVISGGDFKASGNVTVITSAGAVQPFGLFSFPGNLGTSGATLISKGNGTTQWNAGSSNYSVEIVSGNTTGVAGTTYVLISGTTFTLPVSPATGDYLVVINRSNTTTGTVDRNGSSIMGLAENLEINDLNFKTEFIYYGGSEGWVLL